MLVVKVEVWPGGHAERAREIGCIGFANVSALAEVSDYVAVIADGHDGREFAVRGHQRTLGCFELLRKALTDPQPLGPGELAVALAIVERLEER